MAPGMIQEVVFPVFGRGLSLRHAARGLGRNPLLDFPAFGRGLSLRLAKCRGVYLGVGGFPRLWTGPFIEAAPLSSSARNSTTISPPSGGDFH